MDSRQQAELNLARKWRPRQFDQIVGQPLPVRMLKNSLYADRLFPVYVFSGERGCGKTTTARIFAAAINCAARVDFMQRPQEVALPCLQCESCVAMHQGSHPDYIEIDAASHTGVDHVRQMLESAQHLPVGSGKKIYLIDEVHMLSKAAFNAFLKMLEEPPASVIFMLATTELEKIPETVRSRTFQLFFGTMSAQVLGDHIKYIAAQEDIALTDQIIDLIVQAARGSARDALNVLERVRFLGSPLTLELVRSAFGTVDEHMFLPVLDAVLAQDATALFTQCATIRAAHPDPEALWRLLARSLHALLRLLHGQESSHELSIEYVAQLQTRVGQCSVVAITHALHTLWEHELQFLKTPHKQLFFEHVLMQLAQPQLAPAKVVKTETRASTGAPRSTQSAPEATAAKPAAAKSVTPVSPVMAAPTPSAATPPVSMPVTKAEGPQDARWQAFLEAVQALNDPLLLSIIAQMRFMSVLSEQGVVEVELAQQSRFFDQMLNDRKALIAPILERLFSGASWFKFHVRAMAAPTPQAPRVAPAPQAQQASSSAQPKGSGIDVSNQEQWPQTHCITKYFPGTVEKIEE